MQERSKKKTMESTQTQLLYGGDYNPEQWLEDPGILREDLRMMKKAHVNTVSVGIFSWAKLEPREGVYELDWLEEIINRLWENGIFVILATPSGARPHWMADRYPEILRVNAQRQRELFGTRHNHCLTSPIYREKVRRINTLLAKRFDAHPAVRLWHISNEYGGECHCPLCQQAFRDWLKDRYQTIEEVNRRWNTMFWSHTYESFDQIESPSVIGESSIQGLTLDWRRFVSHQTTDFCRAEIAALREAGAKKPATTNMMYYYEGINYHELARTLDVASWDNYPTWHKGPESETAMDTGMMHDVIRSLKRQPFLLMESCPGATNWQSVSKLKKPGMLEAASWQAVAHGADSVLYFQIRKSRGGFEKFHGAMIDHYGGEDDRTYQECVQVGSGLEKLSYLAGAATDSPVAVIYDWENLWALEGSQGPRNEGMHYREAVKKSYGAFRRMGLNVDVIDMTQSLTDYRIVAAPVLYLFRDGFAEKAKAYVESGGILILTYWSGVVDENDLCVLGGTPGGLMEVLGLRSTEIDGLYDWERNRLVPAGGAEGESSYECRNLCQLVKTTTARALYVYGEDFYAGTPALTVNRYGAGQAYYVCADMEESFYNDFYCRLISEAKIPALFSKPLPDGIEVTTRQKGQETFVFLQNFNRFPVSVEELMPELEKMELLYDQDGEASSKWSPVRKPYSTLILKKNQIMEG